MINFNLIPNHKNNHIHSRITVTDSCTSSMIQDSSHRTLRTVRNTLVQPLSKDFEPGNFDVICGRGKTCYNHPGNINFRKLVETYLTQYDNARSKVAKSMVVSAIANDVRRQSPTGGFVKQDTDTGMWVEVGEYMAREKIGQALRDSLHMKYRSSTAVSYTHLTLPTIA